VTAKIAVVTDSASALPADLARRHGITVVSMSLAVGGVPEPEGQRPLAELVDIPDVTTSAPPPGEFEAAIKDRLRTHDGVVVLTIAGSMSASFQAATVAAAAVGGPVRVIDTGVAGGAEALAALAAAETATGGGDLDAVDARGRAVSEGARLTATLPSLDHLVRSGRVPGVAGWAGRQLGINPIFEFRSGTVHRMRAALSRESALDRIVARVWRTQADGTRLHVAAQHALAPDAADYLLAAVRERTEPATAFIAEFGPVMVVHTGPGVAGLAWWWES
jgi:DegV family protein with EDD domain